MVDMKNLGIFFLGIVVGTLIPSLPIPEELNWLVPYSTIIFLILAVIALIKH
jgi:hypothetical protein